eukprot:CAMPEP_0172178706 /NCGR_PEP_ID=MMETSP1050-20130122/16192_1 /TAXON_ID=233186 /ORGANISM="Cryptomonas curvata, Strain CCAP979/52" /LENGTH=96 /DNA_ID=CAMNT_0012851469 /DNA_START=365 /DNA_END=651 /DNA_ORIENTATION=+
MSFPMVLKPRRGAGSNLVRRADSRDELRAVFLWAREALTAPFILSNATDTPPLMVEELIEGPEVDIDVVMRDGEPQYMAVVDNLPPPQPGFFMEAG